ncbi:MAG TPA: hypothetical protein VGE74_06775 [Gemmata sp.]
MANFIAIDLEASGVYAVAGTARGTAKVLHAVAWTGEDGAPPPALALDTARAFGEALREKLRAAGPGAPVLVAVGRDRVILKELKHPPVPPAEEPALIKFQAVKEMSESPDDVVLDYVPLGAGAAPAAERRAMAVMLRKDVFHAIQAMCAAAGLKLAGVTPRPYAVAAGLARAFALGAAPAPERKTDTVAALTLGPSGGEFTVVRNGEMILTLAIPAPVLASESMLVAQLRRNLTVYAGQHPGHPIEAVYAAEVGPGWSGRLATALGVPVHDYDPLTGAAPEVPEHLRGRFAGAVGLLAARAHGDLPINFAAPRQPRNVSDPGKRRLVFVAATAAALLGCAGLLGAYFRVATGQTVDNLTAQRDAIKESLDKGATDARQADAIDAWTKRRVVYLDELHDLADRLPADDSVRVTSITATPGAVAKDGKQATQANVELRLAATAAKPVSELVTEFDKDNPVQEKGKPAVRKYYVGTVTTGGGALAGSTGSGRHTQGFTVRTQLNYRDPSKYERQPSFTPPKRSWGLSAPVTP